MIAQYVAYGNCYAKELNKFIKYGEASHNRKISGVVAPFSCLTIHNDAMKSVARKSIECFDFKTWKLYELVDKPSNAIYCAFKHRRCLEFFDKRKKRVFLFDYDFVFADTTSEYINAYVDFNLRSKETGEVLRSDNVKFHYSPALISSSLFTTMVAQRDWGMITPIQGIGVCSSKFKVRCADDYMNGMCYMLIDGGICVILDDDFGVDAICTLSYCNNNGLLSTANIFGVLYSSNPYIIKFNMLHSNSLD